MRRDLKGRLSLDTSTLIELLYSTKVGLKLREAMKELLIDPLTTELHVAELRYILCRRLGTESSKEKVDKLLASGYITVEEMSSLILDASEYKCKRAISLADCFCLALAKKSFGGAIFARRESELVEEMTKEQFDVEIIFLEDYG
jgi:predicted nucleic acid-binding protein